MEITIISCLIFLIVPLFSVYRIRLLAWALFFMALCSYVFLRFQLDSTAANLIGLSVLALISAVFLLFSIPVARCRLLVRPLYRAVRKQKPRISLMEKQALTAGNAGFDKSLFAGKPDWLELANLPGSQLSDEEQAILEGPTAEICELIDDWDIRNNKREIPDE